VFDNVRGACIVGNCYHPLLNTAALAILAVLCAAEDWPEIELCGSSSSPAEHFDRREEFRQRCNLRSVDRIWVSV